MTKRIMSQKSLQKLANKLYRKYFHHNLHCLVKYNNRLRTTAGRFGYDKRKSAPYEIEINPSIFGYSKCESNDTIKHELIHYHLYINGYPCGHNQYFKNIAKKIGCSIYMPSDFGHSANELYHVYQCQSCGNVIVKKYRLNTKGYVCANKITNDFGITTTCNGKWKSCGTIPFNQLNKKNNKVDRLKKNFKRRANTKHRYATKLNHVLGYNELRIHTITERTNIQGNMMSNVIGRMLAKLSSHAQSQFVSVVNKEHVYTSQQAINRIKAITKNMAKDGGIVYDYVSKSAPKVIKQLKNTPSTFVGLELDTEAGEGWYITGFYDSDFLDDFEQFADKNYTNGIKLYKMMIAYMSKHNQDYKTIEANERKQKQVRA